MFLVTGLDRFNQRHPWSHNDHYGRWVASRIAESGARTILDVGCGTGNLVDLLRHRADRVTGLEPDPGTAHLAKLRFADDEHVNIEQTTFAQRDPQQRWDAIALVAVLHHLPLTATLRELKACLTPGGRLVIVGCYRQQGWRDAATSLPSLIANPVVGLFKNPRAANAPPENMTAPTQHPKETLAEIYKEVTRLLPGAKVHRRMFWRYTVVYDANVTASQTQLGF